MELMRQEDCRSIRVLIVDNDKDILWTLKDVLEVFDFTIETACSGFEALDLLKRTQVDCILMDVVMPELTGLDTFRRIKASECRTPVIFMTGYAHFNLEGEAREEGALDVLSKPLDVKQLIALIRSATDRRDAA